MLKVRTAFALLQTTKSDGFSSAPNAAPERPNAAPKTKTETAKRVMFIKAP
jgi:hypothetical protein